MIFPVRFLRIFRMGAWVFPVRDIGSLGTADKAVADFLCDGRSRDAVSRVDADMRELTNTVPRKMWFSGSRGGVLFLDARFFEYTGLTPKQARGMGWTMAVHPDDLGLCIDTRARDDAVKNGELSTDSKGMPVNTAGISPARYRYSTVSD